MKSMKQAKVCLECIKEYMPRDNAFSEAWSKRQFCSARCGILFRRRSRTGKPHPPEVLAEVERQGILLRPENSTIAALGVSTWKQ